MVYLRQKEKEKKDITATQNVSKDTPKELQELPESQLKESREFYRQFVEWYAKEFDFNNDIPLKELYLKKALSGELENSFAKQYNTAIDDFTSTLIRTITCWSYWACCVFAKALICFYVWLRMQTLQSTITLSKVIQSYKANNNNILANALIGYIACIDSVSNICIKYNIARQAFYKCKSKLDLMTENSLFMYNI